jgi:biotin carboxyl carrier protein
MPYHIKIKNRTSKIEILEHNNTFYKIRIGEKIYQLDAVKVENGVYSIIHNGKSINMEMIEAETPNKYIVNTRNSNYRVEIIDAKARYKALNKGTIDDGENIIVSPMPGKVVSIPVNVGNKVKKGDTVIVISAMKMESEYKSPFDGIVSNIYVKNDQTIDGNQKLVEIEPFNKQ